MEESKKIARCDIFLTRKCNYKCKYCAVTQDSVETERDLGKWKETLQALKTLGSETNTIGGAEPLLEKDLLLEILKYSAEIDLPVTLVTNGSLISQRTAEELCDSGLRSVALSYDGNYVYVDAYSARKSSHAERVIGIFKSLGVRDVGIIVTVSRRNFRELPELVSRFSKAGVWISLDLVHYDRGQPGSRCAPRRELEDVLFNTRESISDLKKVLLTLKRLGVKRKFLLRQDNDTLSIICKRLPTYSWACNNPNFIAVDANLTVRPCDDFCPQEIRDKYRVPDLLEKWDEFQSLRRKLRQKYSCHCLWTSYIMSESV